MHDRYYGQAILMVGGVGLGQRTIELVTEELKGTEVLLQCILSIPERTTK